MYLKINNIIKQKNGMSLIALILGATISFAILISGAIFANDIMANMVSSKEKLQATELAYNQWLIYESKPYDAVESDNLDKDANAADNKFAVVTTVGAEEIVDAEGSSKKKHIKIEVYKTNNTDKGQVLAYTLEADKIRPYLNNYYSKGEIDSKFTGLNTDMDNRINKANGILALYIPPVPSWSEPVIPAWREIPEYKKRDCPITQDLTDEDGKTSEINGNVLDFTMLENGEVYFTHKNSYFVSVTVNGSTPSGWNVTACGSGGNNYHGTLICNGTSPKHRLRKGDKIHLTFIYGVWDVHAKYDNKVCGAGKPDVTYVWRGDTSCNSDDLPADGVYGSGLFNNTWRMIRIPADGILDTTLDYGFCVYKLKKGQSITYSARNEGWSWDRSKADWVCLNPRFNIVNKDDQFLGVKAPLGGKFYKF